MNINSKETKNILLAVLIVLVLLGGWFLSGYKSEDAEGTTYSASGKTVKVEGGKLIFNVPATVVSDGETFITYDEKTASLDSETEVFVLLEGDEMVFGKGELPDILPDTGVIVYSKENINEKGEFVAQKIEILQ